MMHILPTETGWIEMICGCMFSGKTEELIKRLRRAEIARLNLAVFKPEIDKRYDKKKIASHSSLKFDATIVNHSSEILAIVFLTGNGPPGRGESLTRTGLDVNDTKASGSRCG